MRRPETRCHAGDGSGSGFVRGAGRPLRTAVSTPALVGPRRSRRRTLTLLPDEPEGRIITRSAGAVEVRARLDWRPGHAPPGPVLQGFHDRGRSRCTFVEETEESTGSRIITGEIRAFTEVDLSVALETFLRAISASAALSEAVMEARSFRRCRPVLARVSAVEALARDLRAAGFSFDFGRSWNEATGAGAALGIGGAAPDFLDFLERHPVWACS